MSIKGTHELMPPGRLTIRRGPARITFHEPITVAGLTRSTMAKLVEKVRAAVSSGLTS